LVVVQEIVEEIIDRETESTLKGGEYLNLIIIGCRDVLPDGKALLQHREVQEKMVRNKLSDFIFTQHGWLEQVRMRGDHGSGEGLRQAQSHKRRKGGGRREIGEEMALEEEVIRFLIRSPFQGESSKGRVTAHVATP
jgi:hypothetical protein